MAEQRDAEDSGVVLVVDDDLVLAELLVTAFAAYGRTAIAVTGFEEAVRYLTQDARVNWLVTDFGLNDGYDGLDLCRRALRLRQEVACVVMSGNIADIDVSGVRPAPKLLAKPFAISELLKTVS